MHLVAKSYIHEACAEFREEGENESESMRLFEVRLRDGHAGDNHGEMIAGLFASRTVSVSFVP